MLGTYIIDCDTSIQVDEGSIVEIDAESVDSITVDVIMLNNGAASELKITALGTTNRATNLCVEHPSGTGYFVGVLSNTSIYIHPLSSFDVLSRHHNTITVDKTDSLYTTLSTAIASINPQVSVVINGTTSVTSSAAFNVSMTGFASAERIFLPIQLSHISIHRQVRYQMLLLAVEL